MSEPRTAEETIALLRSVAEGRREYAQSIKDAPLMAHNHDVLITQATIFDQAADIAAGDLKPLYGLLPSWRWTDEMVERLEQASGLGTETDRPAGEMPTGQAFLDEFYTPSLLSRDTTPEDRP